MSSTAMSSQLLVFLCMVLVSLAIILQGVSAARDLTHTMHASYGGYRGGHGGYRGGYGGFHGGMSDSYGGPP
ncbi:hypothetical protein PVAP13_4NG084900 [Panicum virgatum]|uniref:Glycine-rich protein n=1 Tax=Panicum virgatum TaxID=38727 RepID=A0A8T0T3N8_PANVG|nr:hypothetical protein PVAP13_4NG084900 [Panicum virgatum]